MTLWNQGRKEDARASFKKAVTVTSEMALKLIEVSKK
jgi:hypothetical protein